MNLRRYLMLLTCSLFIPAPTVAMPPPRSQSSTASSYSNSAEGLQKLVWDMIDAQKKGGTQVVAPILQSLTLPNSGAWFANVFGDNNGRQFATFYDAWEGARDFQLSGDLARAIAAQMTDIAAMSFDKPGDAGTNDKDNYFLGLRQQPETFYVVIFKSPDGATMRWAYFVHAAGAFRYLGPLADLRLAAVHETTRPAAQPISQPETTSSAAMPKRVRISASVIESHIANRVEPVYPPEALKNRLEGTVVLHAMLAPDGSVQSLDAVEGNSVFVPAAEAAVKQWRYQPVLLNGSAVGVDTTISVRFHLPAGLAVGQAGAPAASIPSFPDSSGGLTKMMKQMLDLAKSGNNQALAAYYRALLLPNPESWFPSQFGGKQGTQFASSYENFEQTLPAMFSNALQTDTGLKFDRIEVRRFKNSCDMDASEFEYPILAAREEQSTPLYEVRFLKDLSYRWLFPFAYVDGGFRYLGNLQIQAPKNQIIVSQSGDSSSGNGVEWPKAIRQVPPIFPQGINQNRNSGQVKLWGVIGTDGTVRDLHVIEGTCAFSKATINAVKKWRYTPLMVSGKAQEVYYPFDYSYTPGR